MTVAPAAAKRGAWARLPVAPAEKRAMSMPAGSAVSTSSMMIVSPPNSTAVPAERAVAKQAQLADREGALGEDLAHHGAHLAGGADDGDGESGIGDAGHVRILPSRESGQRPVPACTTASLSPSRP